MLCVLSSIKEQGIVANSATLLLSGEIVLDQNEWNHNDVIWNTQQ